MDPKDPTEALAFQLLQHAWNEGAAAAFGACLKFLAIIRGNVEPDIYDALYKGIEDLRQSLKSEKTDLH